jgi:hypothetical protein
MMSFPIERQNKLIPILVKFRAIPGVKSVQSDDWTSVDIRVFLELDFQNKKPTHPIRNIKSSIRKILNDCGFSWIDCPEKRYTTYSFRGERERIDLGYDSHTICVDVWV